LLNLCRQPQSIARHNLSHFAIGSALLVSECTELLLCQINYYATAGLAGSLEPKVCGCGWINCRLASYSEFCEYSIKCFCCGAHGSTGCSPRSSWFPSKRCQGLSSLSVKVPHRFRKRIVVAFGFFIGRRFVWHFLNMKTSQRLWPVLVRLHRYILDLAGKGRGEFRGATRWNVSNYSL
jgi:hypothetical protein